MKIKFHSAVVFTRDFEIMKSFYAEVLMQEIDFDFGNCIGFKNGLSLWQLKDEYPIAQKLERTFSDLGNNNLELCFETDDFDAVAESLQHQNIKYLHYKAEELWGQQTIRFYDPENNLIEIGETIACFVKRFRNSGMTIEEIAARTSVPATMVAHICQ
jgi:catechol 2,3-dioxygenase-like lactoylglutathione lyase family enzyme